MSIFDEFDSAKDTVEEILSKCCQNVKDIRSELGAFVYSDDCESQDLEMRPPAYYPNGDIYLGHWHAKKEVLHGRGIFFYSNSESTKQAECYEGYWKDCKSHGKGRIIYQDGEYYEGQFF